MSPPRTHLLHRYWENMNWATSRRQQKLIEIANKYWYENSVSSNALMGAGCTHRRSGDDSGFLLCNIIAGTPVIQWASQLFISIDTAISRLLGDLQTVQLTDIRTWCCFYLFLRNNHGVVLETSLSTNGRPHGRYKTNHDFFDSKHLWCKPLFR